MPYRIGFVIEQALGHITHGQNLQAIVAKYPSIEPYWSLPTWEASGFAGKVPNWTVRAGLQARQDVAKMRQKTTLDALFFHTQVTAQLSQKWLKRYPSVVSIDATPMQYDELGQYYDHSAGPGWLEQQKWRLNRNIFRNARYLVSWSHWAKKGLGDYEVPPEKVTVIPPGVNVSEWTRPELRQIDSSPVRILFVGGNLERKGGVVLLEAFRRLRERLAASAFSTDVQPAVELHLVTRAEVSPEPGLFIYGDMQPNSDRLKQLYFDSDIFCLPTYGDCLPMALAEAGAASLPLVASNVAAIPEMVRDDETGFLTPRGDVDALTNVLQRLIDHPSLRIRLGAQAAQLVKAEHDAEYNTRRLLDLLRTVANSPHKSPLT